MTIFCEKLVSVDITSVAILASLFFVSYSVNGILPERSEVTLELVHPAILKIKNNANQQLKNLFFKLTPLQIEHKKKPL